MSKENIEEKYSEKYREKWKKKKEIYWSITKNRIEYYWRKNIDKKKKKNHWKIEGEKSKKLGKKKI